MADAAQFLRPEVRALTAYVPGTQPEGEGWIKLNTNENPFPPPPSVLAAIAAEASSLQRYPSPTARPLREKAAAVYGVSPDRVIAGNGSDDILNLLVRACVPPGGAVAAADPGYGLYAILAAAHGARYLPVDYPEDWSPPPAAQWPRADLYVLTHPNSPAGPAAPPEQVAELVDALPGLVVVDEAYADFARSDCLGLLHRCPNLFICRTFSKSFSLAGLRLGLGLGPPAVIAGLDRLRDSYNVSRLAIAAGVAALDDLATVRERVAEVVATRQRVAQALEQRGLRVRPSEANFLLVEVGPSAAALQRALAQQRVLVRHFSHPRLAETLRVSIGSAAEMDAFLSRLDAALQHA